VGNNPAFIIVGAYECAELEALPSHVSPIVAEATTEGFRRWRYKITKPYRISLEGPIGPFRKGIGDLFPVRSYTSIEPVAFVDTVQLIAISQARVIVSEHKMILALRVISLAVRKWNRPSDMRRILITLVNIFL
jgi:hypothetical protein